MTLPSRRTLALIAGAVVLLALLGAGGWFWYAEQQRRGIAAYAEAMTRVQVAQGGQAPAEAREAAIRDLEGALQKYPSAATAAQAALQLGNLRYGAQQYPAARGAYGVALAKAGSGTIATLARLGIAAAWEAERNYAKAAEAYQATLGPMTAKGFLFEELLVDLGRVQERGGKKADAIATYQRLLKDAPQTRRGEEVRARLAALGAKP